MINKKQIKINKIDVEYRDLEDLDNQYKIMSNILDYLSDKQLNNIRRLIKQEKQTENKPSGFGGYIYSNINK